MRKYVVGGALSAVVLLAGSLLAGESLKSGPQAGNRIPGPFNPLNVTGDNAGSKTCQV